MGCGSSLPDDGDKSPQQKYRSPVSKKGPGGNQGADPSGDGSGSPSDGALGASTVQQPPKPTVNPDDLVVGFVKQAPKDNVVFTCGVNRLPLKPAPVASSSAPGKGGMNDLIDFVSVLRGCFGVVRGPPARAEKEGSAGVGPVRICPDFSETFTVNLTAEELHEIETLTVGELFSEKYLPDADGNLRKIILGDSATAPAALSFGTPTTPPLKPLSAGGAPPPMSLDGGGGSGGSSKMVLSSPPTKLQPKAAEAKVRATASAFLAQHVLKHRIVEAKVRDVALRQISTGCSKCIASIALSPDERVIALATVAGPDLQVRRFNQQLQLPAQTTYSMLTSLAMNSVALSVRTIETRTGRAISIFTDEEPMDVALTQLFFTRDGQAIYGSCIEGLSLWDTNKRRKLKNIQFGREYDLPTRVNSAALSSDGRTAAVAAESDNGTGCVGLFRENKQTLCFTEHRFGCSSVAFSPSGNLVASGDYEGEVAVWTANDGRFKYEVKGHTEPVHSMLWLDETTLVTQDPVFVRAWHVPPLDEEGKPQGSVMPKWTRSMDSDEPTPWTPGDSPTMKSNDERKRLTRVCKLPGNLFAILQCTRELLVVSANGETFTTISTRCPVVCLSAGYTMAVLGDLWGNIYALDFEMSHSLQSGK